MGAGQGGNESRHAADRRSVPHRWTNTLPASRSKIIWQTDVPDATLVFIYSFKVLQQLLVPAWHATPLYAPAASRRR